MVEIKMPQLGLTMENGLVAEWLKHEGDPVSAGEAIVLIETDKLSSEIICEEDGVLLKILVEEGSDIPVQTVLAYVGQPGEEIAPQEASKPSKEAAESRIPISPYAKKTAAELGVDYRQIEGTGPNNRIVHEDIMNEAKRMNTSAAAPVVAAKPEAADEVIRMSGMRKAISDRMLKSHTEIPPVTQTIKVDVTELMRFRKHVQECTGVKYSVNDFVLKATAKALKEHRNIMVSLDGNQIIQKSQINLGVAVSVDGGLIVPVIRNADQLSLNDISESVKDLATRARNNQLTSDEYQGSTFTVSNLGMYGIDSFTPIINQPNAAILGVCAAQPELAMDDEGNVYQKQVMKLCVTFDHRLLDGAEVGKFQMTLRNLLEKSLNIIL